jgi:CcmD family protein
VPTSGRAGFARASVCAAGRDRSESRCAVSTEAKYVAAAYLVVFLVVLAYVVIIATKLARLERELAELAELALRRREQEETERKALAVG